MSDLLTRIRVLATSALSWLTAISAVLVVLAQQLDIVSVVGVDVPEWVPRVLASVIAVIGVIIVQVRGRTPVSDSLSWSAPDKGLLPPKGPAIPAGDAAGEAVVP